MSELIGAQTMAIPYPPDAPGLHSQEVDVRVRTATRVIEESLDERLGWDELLERLAGQLRLSLDDPRERTWIRDAFLIAELDLEWTNAIIYEDDYFRRPGQPDDPAPVAPERLREVAEAVWSLGWPSPGHKPSRTIHECFLELGNRYRHCDVYWAMHKFLKGNRLRVVRRNWMLLADAEAVLADRTLTVADAQEIEHELERDLVEAYVAWLNRSGVRKHLFHNSREADLYDKSRRLIIEAKASHSDDVLVAHGMGQAMYYRALGELDPEATIAVLLPGRPSTEVLRLLWTYEVGLIYRSCDGFVEHLPLASPYLA